MTAATKPGMYRKRYREAAERHRAEQNYRWLASVGGPVRLPQLLAARKAGPRSSVRDAQP